MYGSRTFDVWCNGRETWSESWLNAKSVSFKSVSFKSEKVLGLNSLGTRLGLIPLSSFFLPGSTTSFGDITLICVYCACAALKGRSASEEKLSQTAPPELPSAGRTTTVYLLLLRVFVNVQLNTLFRNTASSEY